MATTDHARLHVSCTNPAQYTQRFEAPKLRGSAAVSLAVVCELSLAPIILPLSPYCLHVCRCAILLAASILWLQALNSDAQFFIPTLKFPTLDPSRAACGQACFETIVKGPVINIPGTCASGDPKCFCETYEMWFSASQYLLYNCVSKQAPGCDGIYGDICCPPEGPCCDDMVGDGPTPIYNAIITASDGLCDPVTENDGYNGGIITDEYRLAAALFLSSRTPTNTSTAAAPASRKLLQSLPKFGDMLLVFYLDYVVFNVTLTNLDVLFTAVPDFGNVTISHMHVQGGNSSTHLAYFVDAAEGDSIELPRSGDYLLASGELAIDEFDVPDTNMSLTEYVLRSLSDIFADIHTTSCQPPCEALRGDFVRE